MQWVRRHRQKIIVVFSLGAIVAMTFGYLKRIGMDPLSGNHGEASPLRSQRECDPQPYEGRCELVDATTIQVAGGRALRARYRLMDGPSNVRVPRMVSGDPEAMRRAIEAEPLLQCRGEWMAGPCPTGPFVFRPLVSERPYE